MARTRKKYIGNRFSAAKKSGNRNRARQLNTGTAVRGTMYKGNSSNSNRKHSMNTKTKRNMS